MEFCCFLLPQFIIYSRIARLCKAYPKKYNFIKIEIYHPKIKNSNCSVTSLVMKTWTRSNVTEKDDVPGARIHGTTRSWRRLLRRRPETGKVGRSKRKPLKGRADLDAHNSTAVQRRRNRTTRRSSG